MNIKIRAIPDFGPDHDRNPTDNSPAPAATIEAYEPVFDLVIAALNEIAAQMATERDADS